MGQIGHLFLRYAYLENIFHGLKKTPDCTITEDVFVYNNESRTMTIALMQLQYCLFKNKILLYKLSQFKNYTDDILRPYINGNRAFLLLDEFLAHKTQEV